MVWAGYSRVSRVAGRENLISPELQEKRVRAFADVKGWTVEFFPPELDVSGGRSRRPVLEEIISRIERGEFAGVIVSQIDRLSRMEMTTALSVIERIEEAGGQVVAVAENVDPTTPEGRMARNMFLSLAAMERERHAVQIAGAKERAVRLGIWPVPKVPPGYVKGEDRKLTPGPGRGRLVEAFEARAAGKSWRVVGEILDVGPSSARKIVSNRVYLGEITVGEWNNPTAHEPLIDRRLFEAAQIEHPYYPPKGDKEHLLRGLVRCAGCQRSMSVHGGTFYRCLRKVPCEIGARVRIDEIDPIAERIVFEEGRGAAAEGVEVEAEPLAELERAEAELQAFQRATSAIGDEEFFIEGLRERAEAVRAARTKVSTRRGDLPLIPTEKIWPDLSIDEKRQVLGRLVGVVFVWSRDRFRFVEAGFEPEGLSRPGRKGPKPTPLDDSPLEGEIRIPPAEDVD
jgi:DNA invertase Pin-like site-specific DNA recombinase